jgi:hypothetical protein
LTEKYKALALSEEPSEESDGGGSDYYEWILNLKNIIISILGIMINIFLLFL